MRKGYFSLCAQNIIKLVDIWRKTTYNNIQIGICYTKCIYIWLTERSWSTDWRGFTPPFLNIEGWLHEKEMIGQMFGISEHLLQIVPMTAYEIISIFIGILALLMSFE